MPVYVRLFLLQHAHRVLMTLKKRLPEQKNFMAPAWPSLILFVCLFVFVVFVLFLFNVMICSVLFPILCFVFSRLRSCVFCSFVLFCSSLLILRANWSELRSSDQLALFQSKPSTGQDSKK